MSKTFITATPPNLIGQPSVNFRQNDFEALIHTKGYDILIEKALRCPCEVDKTGIRSDCQNCFGTGYFFINPLKTRAIITGININSQYKDWSVERIGNVSLTVRDDDKENLSFMDKVSLTGKYAKFSQNLKVRYTNNGVGAFVFTTYKIRQIEAVYAFDQPNAPLVKLSPENYSISTVNECVLNIDSDEVPVNGQLSVHYKHEIQYNVIDLPHELRASYIKNKDGREERIFLPMNAVARRSHFVLNEAMNFDGTGTQNNSDY
jgi:hypothetical protein